MRRFLVENMGNAIEKEGNLVVLENTLKNGVYKYDEDYVEIGEVKTIKEYELGLRVFELDTGDKVVEVKVGKGLKGDKYRYIRMV